MSKSAEIVDFIAANQAWTDERVIELLCRFVDEQGASEKLREFLCERGEEDDLDEAENELEAPLLGCPALCTFSLPHSHVLSKPRGALYCEGQDS